MEVHCLKRQVALSKISYIEFRKKTCYDLKNKSRKGERHGNIQI